MTSFTIRVDGPPTGKARPRVNRNGHAYTPDATTRAEERVRAAWVHAGRPHLGDGPLAMVLSVVVDRPKAHWLVDGTLSAAGRRAPYPTSRPDLDNVWKLVADSLNGCAYRDDAQLTHVNASRCWAGRDEHAHMLITLLGRV